MKAARAMQRGGVGWYPHSSFMHIDTGPVRNWTSIIPSWSRSSSATAGCIQQEGKMLVSGNGPHRRRQGADGGAAR